MRAADPLSVSPGEAAAKRSLEVCACRGGRDSTGFCNCLGDERSPPRHLAGLRILFFHNVTHLNLPLEVTRLFTFKGAPLSRRKEREESQKSVTLFPPSI